MLGSTFTVANVFRDIQGRTSHALVTFRRSETSGPIKS